MVNLLNCVCFLFPQQAKHTVTFKQLSTTTQTPGHKPNLPLIRNPTKTIQIPQDFVKKLLCSETLDVTGEESSKDSKTEVSVDGKTIFISTKPVKPAAALQKGNSSQPPTNHSVEQVPQKSETVVGVVSNNLGPKKTENNTDSSIPKDSLVVSEESSSVLKTSAPESPPFHPISPVEIRESPSVQKESLSQASSLPIPLSPYLQLCQGSSRGTSPLLSRCSSLGSVSEPDRMYGLDSQVSAQCRSKSVSPNVLVVQNGVGGCQRQSPVITSTPVQPIISSSSLSSSVAGPSNIPNSCIQTSLITTGVAAAVGAPVRLGVPLPVTRVTVAPPQVALVPGVSTQSTVGQFMPISSVLPPTPSQTITHAIITLQPNATVYINSHPYNQSYSNNRNPSCTTTPVHVNTSRFDYSNDWLSAANERYKFLPHTDYSTIRQHPAERFPLWSSPWSAHTICTEWSWRVYWAASTGVKKIDINFATIQPKLKSLIPSLLFALYLSHM